MKIRKTLSALLVASLLATGITGCGGSKADNTGSSDGNKKVKIGVVGAVYDEIWAPTKEKLAGEGIELEIVQFGDYTTPNNALNSGEIDLNAFQHQIFLDTDVANNGYEIETIGYTFIIPLNLYSNKITSVEEIKDGDTIAIPNDVTNGGRALKVLQAAGLITLKADAPDSPLVSDIEKYNVGIEIIELGANTIPSALDDVTAAIVNGNYALDFGLKIENAVFTDTSLNEEKYWNLVAAKSSDLEDAEKVETYRKIIETFQSDETKKVFDEQFGGYFISVGWDKDLLTK